MSTTGLSWSGGDRELEQLAAEPARPLFPLLGHADAMIPFVVILAFLPPLYAVANRTLTEQGAWLGLAGLKCLAVADPSELFDASAFHSFGDRSSDATLESAPEPSLDPVQPYRFQPPFMTWLTALAMNGFGIGNAAGLVAAAYFCTAGLLIASYILAKRLGGERLGLITVLLLAFNPQILRGAQEPVPQSAAVLFALLALAGLLVHWQKSSAFVSYPLLLAGIALGICLMAGGPVTLAVMAIVLVYVLCWKFEAWQRDRTGIVWDRSQFSRRTALRSALVLAATGFALAGWSVLLPGSRYGGDFWNEWLRGPAIAAAASDLTSGLTPDVTSEMGPSRSSFIAAICELNRLAVAVFSLSLLGMAAIIRGFWRAEEDPARRHAGILLVWVAVALLAWLLLGGPLAGRGPIINVWETLLAIPLIIAAAMGMIEIVERRVGFLLSLAFGLAALADSAVWGRQGLAGANWENQQGEISETRGWALGLFVVLAVAAAGITLTAYARASEKRRRIVLSGMLLAIVIVNCLWGAITVRRTNTGDRELDDLRAGLSKLTQVDRCTFVALSSPGRSSSGSLTPRSSPRRAAPSQPPAELIYTLASLWPKSTISFAQSWESAMRSSGSEAALPRSGVAVFIAWSPRGRGRGTAPDTILKTATAPFLFHGLEVVAYVRDREPLPRADEVSEIRVD
jgi:4-amino-4-deoxy-L-arabinose transferase-like glycosyltransferase